MMDSNSDLMTRVIIVLTLALVIGKIAGPIAKYLLSLIEHKKRKKEEDLDYLIEKQKQLLSGGKMSDLPATDNDGDEKGPDKFTPKLSRTELEYARFFKSDSIDKNSYKEVFTLFDNAKWGEGPGLTKIKNELKKEFRLEVDVEEISKTVNHLIRHDTFIAINSPHPADFTKIMNLIKCKLILDYIYRQLLDNNYKAVSRLVKTSRLSDESLGKAAEFIILKNHKLATSKEKIYLSILNTEEKSKKKYNINDIDRESLFNLSLNIIFTDKRRDFITPKMLFEQISTEARIFDMLTPLPELKSKNDLETAYLIFKADLKTSPKEIKKKYKKLAFEKHPDRLEGLDFPHELKDIAHNNFTRLQAAYEVLKKKTRK